jgi:glycogen synthase
MRVEVGGRDDAVPALAQALAAQGVTTTPVDDHHIDVDTQVHGDVTFDLVRDAVADLGLRLYAVSTRHRSLDDVFLQEAYR